MHVSREPFSRAARVRIMNTGTTQAEPGVRLFMNEDHNAGEKGRHNDGNKDHRIHTPRTADGPRVEAARVSKSFPASLLAGVIGRGFKRWLELRTDQGCGVTCIPAGIDE